MEDNIQTRGVVSLQKPNRLFPTNQKETAALRRNSVRGAPPVDAAGPRLYFTQGVRLASFEHQNVFLPLVKMGRDFRAGVVFEKSHFRAAFVQGQSQLLYPGPELNPRPHVFPTASYAHTQGFSPTHRSHLLF